MMGVTVDYVTPRERLLLAVVRRLYAKVAAPDALDRAAMQTLDAAFDECERCGRVRELHQGARDQHCREFTPGVVRRDE